MLTQTPCNTMLARGAPATPQAGQRIHHRAAILRKLPVQLQPKHGLVKSHAPRQLVCTAAASPVADALSVEEERLPNCVVQLKVNVTPAMCQQHYKKVLGELQQQVNLPGFRKTTSSKKSGGKKKQGGKSGGALPEAMIINAVGGQAAVNASAVESMLLEVLPMALKRYEDVALAESERIVTDVDSLVEQFAVNKPMEIVLEVQLAPQVVWKGAYTGFTVEVEDLGGEEAVTAQVDERLAKELKDSAQLRVVTGRGVGRGDVAIIDAKVQLKKEDGGLELISDRSKMRMDMETADVDFLPGVVDALQDLVIGESCTVTLTIPDTFNMPLLRGEQVQVDVKLHELFSWDMPAMDDAWANKRFPGCSLAKVKDLLTNSYQKQQEENMNRKITAALSKAVGQLAECEIPEKLIRDFGETEYQARLLEAHGKGLMTFEQMEQLATEEGLAQFVNTQRQELLEAVREVAAIEAIYQEQKLQVPKKEFDGEYAAAAMQFKQQGQEYDEDKLKEQVEETLKARVVLAWLEEANNVVIKPAGST